MGLHILAPVVGKLNNWDAKSSVRVADSRIADEFRACGLAVTGSPFLHSSCRSGSAQCHCCLHRVDTSQIIRTILGT
jgi:hypothetical protein